MIRGSQNIRSQLSTPWSHTHAGVVAKMNTDNSPRPIASAFAVSMFSFVNMERRYTILLCRQCRKATADMATALSAMTLSTRASVGMRPITKGISALPSSRVDVTLYP